MTKYQGLHEYLLPNPAFPVEMSDYVLRLVVTGGLPPSAWGEHSQQWWANDYTSGTHSHAQAWLRAGRRVEWTDREARRVRFSAVDKNL